MRSNHGTQSPQTVPDGYLWLGQVGRPHGVRGAFFLKTKDNRSDWPGYKQVLLQKNDDSQLLAVENSYLSGGKLALQISGIKSREACDELYNAHLFVARSEILTTQDEYVVGDLVGCRVEVEGRDGVYGTVIAVHNFGAQETLEIEKCGSEDTIYFPFLDEFLILVDEQNGLVVVKDETAFLDGEGE